MIQLAPKGQHLEGETSRRRRAEKPVLQAEEMGDPLIAKVLHPLRSDETQLHDCARMPSLFPQQRPHLSDLFAGALNDPDLLKSNWVAALLPEFVL
jgi:hypothetical protein